MSANAHKPIIAILILLVASFSSAHARSEEHTSELQSRLHLVCRLLLEKKKKLQNRSSLTALSRCKRGRCISLLYSNVPGASLLLSSDTHSGLNVTALAYQSTTQSSLN